MIKRRPDEPLVALVRALASRDDDPRRIVHINELADWLEIKLQEVSDQTAGDRITAGHYFYTLARLHAHLAEQQSEDRARIEDIEGTLNTQAPGKPPRMVDIKQFEHTLRNDVFEFAQGNVSPIMGHVIKLQETMKRVQQSIIALQDRLGLDEDADTSGI
jgi:hypothetical protein